MTPPPRTGIFIQDVCYQHRYIRSRDLSAIVERPERLRALKIGLAAAIARLEENSDSKPESESDDLVSALDKLKITTTSSETTNIVSIIHSSATLDLLNNPAVKFIHGDIDGDVYLLNLLNWIKQSKEKISKGESEIPEGLAQGDLYLCPGSLDAIQGALGTVCEAVDVVLDGQSPIDRAFVAIRPPGHHCGEDTPSGFCFVNNVTVAAAHAHLKHGINRVVVFDIDLHHGNGTQSIAWQINEETYRRVLDADPNPDHNKPGLQIYYSSLHDILSYPCEDGKPEFIQAASVSIHGPHGQYIENVHLKPYSDPISESDPNEKYFWEKLYPSYIRLIRKAEEFVESTGRIGDDVLVFISCGFDASIHEHASMSRHGRRVPSSFYYRFTKDVGVFVEKYCAKARIISVLEGGYSDRALISGGMAHLVGLVGLPSRVGDGDGDEDIVNSMDVDQTKCAWWDLKELEKIETATNSKSSKKHTQKRGGRTSLPKETSLSTATTNTPTQASDLSSPTTSTPASSPYLTRTITLLNILDPLGPSASASSSSVSKKSVPVVPSSMTLRDRKPKGGGKKPSEPGALSGRSGTASGGEGGDTSMSTMGGKMELFVSVSDEGKEESLEGEPFLASTSTAGPGIGLDPTTITTTIGTGSGVGEGAEEGSATKKKPLPRVILKLGPNPNP